MPSALCRSVVGNGAGAAPRSADRARPARRRCSLYRGERRGGPCESAMVAPARDAFSCGHTHAESVAGRAGQTHVDMHACTCKHVPKHAVVCGSHMCTSFVTQHRDVYMRTCAYIRMYKYLTKCTNAENTYIGKNQIHVHAKIYKKKT